MLKGGTLDHVLVLARRRERTMWWWILGSVVVFVIPIVVLVRRGSGSGDPGHAPDQPYGSGPSTTPNQWGNGQGL